MEKTDVRLSSPTSYTSFIDEKFGMTHVCSFTMEPVKWGRRGAPARDMIELVYGLETIWRVMQEALANWTPEDLQFSYTEEPGEGGPEKFTRQWVVWHLIEHDLHH